MQVEDSVPGDTALTDEMKRELEITEPQRCDPVRSSWWLGSLTALGIVFGDIGTSPLYAFQMAIHATGHKLPAAFEVIGVVSLVLWSLGFIVAFKYVLVVMRADNEGEGGILALLALVEPSPIKNGFVRLPLVTLAGVLGAALLYGDGVITPAISVLSAMEGLKVKAPEFSTYVVPATLVVLVGLFAIQSRGTSILGRFFGPVMLAWFVAIGGLGLYAIREAPQILEAFNPFYAARFLVQDWRAAFKVFGGVFLVLTGAEALYADMGHVGRAAIQRAWFGLVMPALFLSYLGQGASVLAHPEKLDNPFYKMVPEWALIPMIAIAALATIIASQALISGVFSLTRQAINLRLCPRMTVVPTSKESHGQIYIGVVNWALMAGTLAVVISFRSADNLGAAYGMAVSATMLITTMLLNRVMVRCWKWSWPTAALVTLVFGSIDFVFLASNAIKFLEGGWLPLLIGGVVSYLMIAWRLGISLSLQRQVESSMPIDTFIQEIGQHIRRIPGCSVVLTRMSDTVSPVLVQQIRHTKSLHDDVVLLSLASDPRPRVPAEERIKIIELEKGLHRLIVLTGFMQKFDVASVLRAASRQGLGCCEGDVHYYIGHEMVLRRPRRSDLPAILWPAFSIMHALAVRLPDYLQLPHRRVMEVGYRVSL